MYFFYYIWNFISVAHTIFMNGVLRNTQKGAEQMYTKTKGFLFQFFF